MTRTQTTVIALVALVALVMGLTVYKALNRSGQLNPALLLDAGIVQLPQSSELPAMTLADQDGRPQAVDAPSGRWTLLFFGYTFCPDVCPTTLAELRQLQGLLGEEDRQRLRVVMVTVDPARDTPEQLKQYLGFFDAGFAGLTGELEAIQTLSGRVGIPFIPGDTGRENYTVDHSANLALLGPDGRQHGFIRAPLKVQKLAEALPPLLASRP